jgi:hypothetical protein
MTDKPKTHKELVAAGLRDDCDIYGLIPDNYICVDCGMDTWPGHKTRAEVEQSMRAAKGGGEEVEGDEVNIHARDRSLLRLSLRMGSLRHRFLGGLSLHWLS